MEIINLFDGKNRYLDTYATNRDDTDNFKADVIKAFENARKLLCENPDASFKELLDGELDTLDIVQYYDAFNFNLPKHKALLIFNGKDADLILEDGGYAFLYLNPSDDKIHIDLYQGRITRTLNTEDNIEDAALECSYKTYHMNTEESEVNDNVLTKAIEWLSVGNSLEDFDIERSVNCDNIHQIVNNFLNL